MRRVVDAMNRAEIRVDAIYTSPLVRGEQTARIVAGRLKRAPKPRIAPNLAPSGDPAALVAQLRRQHRSSRVALMLVGHEPALSRLLGVLVSGNPCLDVRLRKSGFCRIDVGRRGLRYGACGTLAWLVAPGLVLPAGSKRE